MKILPLSVTWFALFMFPAITYGTSDSTVVSIQKHLKEAGQFSQSGQVQQSLKHYFDALQLAEATGNTWYTALTSLRIGTLFNQYYRYEESIPYLKRTYNLLNGSDSTKLLASVSNSIAWDYIKINNIDSALTYSEHSIKLYKKIRPQSTIDYCIALESLGEIYSFKGRYEEAQEVLNLSMQLGKEMNNEVVVGFTNYGLALNELNRKNLAQARVHIMACLPVAEKYADDRLLADVHHLAYTILDSRKEDAPAFKQLKKYTALKDKLHSEDIERKAAIINASYEIQKKENEVKILSQRNDIQQLEIERQTLTRNITIVGLIGVLIVAALIYNRIQSQRKFEKRELQRKVEELEKARKIQLSLLPKEPLHNETFEVRGKMVTATEVGGDYYDYFRIDDHRVLIAFADATGHGMTAGLIVTIAKVALINNLSKLTDSNDLMPVVKAVNDSIMKSISARGIGLALQLCIVDSHNRKMHITSCGMPFPMIFNHNTNTVSMIAMKQPPLGFFKEMKLKQEEVELSQQQVLMLSSDGILERFNSKREEYGIERMVKAIESQFSKSSDLQLVIDTVFTDCNSFSEQTANEDDMTMLIARMN